MSALPISEREAASSVAEPWQVADGMLVADYATSNMVRGGEFVARIIDAAEDLNHHPDIDIRYSSVYLALMTHSVGALTELDVDLANAISKIAAELGLT
ncbi:4a-hydroxytetrahydrobiopterin dehydratase [Gordonia sp. (in: high G+C Gram-positive bacteria)]|uniref:4a-hydroxytetrahydrobiopterin dehydratase n=1 Tax=Gordonia sp. (in: high G+C Gram-positive bacteria) TaxID=84139 RepID=UPI001DACDC02|nr:4a-hydroxytetrahydrobiopterin dehydratase [Gordonia sp. (in: high G+C Gram-positive bacteria)]MCB1296391.1 4a-hydroxytetrahydrobiopterin dehydratase [Gordonia sp. (in: high G+C Gram-positive bacteria)]HMS74417.1 4a-hydroxytetrahydrobiopterin dehydratase [Gordonia sp. (in: high G+C Gram-positive bacteria)]HQV19975.1 4a-hydroxytetrahydrobiopterin dehydratase [Gordonia sp. (in: high G+C Gram-positive bacteria)]